MNILEVQDLCKTYGTGETAVHALNHVSFSVKKGEFIAIIGESGSGKSTLLNVIGALDNATSGKVWIDGQDIFSMPEKKLTVFRRQHIGFVFQSFNLIPELNVEQNITFPLLLDYKKPNQKFVNEFAGAGADRAQETFTEPAFRRAAAAGGDWQGISHTAGPDHGR